MSSAQIVIQLVRAIISVAPSIVSALRSGKKGKALAKRRLREKMEREIDKMAAKVALAKRKKH